MRGDAATNNVSGYDNGGGDANGCGNDQGGGDVVVAIRR